MQLRTLDIIVILLYLVFIIWWGIRHGKSSDKDSYFLAGRSFPWWIIGLSLFAASISSTTLIGQCGDAYHTGAAVHDYNLIGVVVMVLFATFLLPLYIRSGIFTIPEFLEKRFDRRSRYYFSIISIIGCVFLDAAGALYAAALIVKLIFPGMSIQMLVIIFALIAASYTIPGGLSSAINTELIQAIILIAGSVILTIACFTNGGGEYLSQLYTSGDLNIRLIRPLTDISVPWLGMIVGMPITSIYFWANNQTLVQRVLSARSVDEGRKGVMLAGFLTLLILFIIIYPGVIARKLFPGIEVPDMIYPTLIMKMLPSGLLGIMLSALLAALTSTLSAILNSASTLVTMDFYAPHHPQADSKKLIRTGRLSALAAIVIAAIWAPQIEHFGSLLKYYQEMLSYMSPPVVAAFLMGMFSRRVNARGAFTGLICGLGVAVVMLFLRQTIFGDLHFLFIVPILLIISMLVMYFASLGAPAPDEGKLKDTTFSVEEFRRESEELKKLRWYDNYRVWGCVLLCMCAALLIIFH